MLENLPEYTALVAALLAIIDPFAAIPVFLSVTQCYSTAQRNRAVNLAMVTAAIALRLFASFGDALRALRQPLRAL